MLFPKRKLLLFVVEGVCGKVLKTLDDAEGVVLVLKLKLLLLEFELEALPKIDGVEELELDPKLKGLEAVLLLALLAVKLVKRPPAGWLLGGVLGSILKKD